MKDSQSYLDQTLIEDHPLQTSHTQNMGIGTILSIQITMAIVADMNIRIILRAYISRPILIS